MPPPIENRVHFRQQVVDDFDFVRKPSLPPESPQRASPALKRLTHVVQFFFHQQTCGRLLNETRDTFGRRVGAMRTAEGVIDVNLAQRGKLRGKLRIVRLFFGMEAQVLEQQHLARLKLARQLGCQLAHAIRRKGHVHLLAKMMIEQHPQPIHDRSQAVFGIHLALGPSQVRSENQLGLVA